MQVDNAQYQAIGVLWHYGGQLSWGPDDRIYLSMGDKQRADWTPRNDKYSGCILRLNKDGSIPSGNLPTSVKPAECWAHGMRNGFRSHWDLQPAGRERYFIAEVGGNNHNTAWEDLHLGAAGKHFGWPVCEGPCANNPDYNTCSCEVHDDPIFTYAHDGGPACIVGGFVYRGTQFPQEYHGAYFFAEFTRQNMQVMYFNEDGDETAANTEIFQSNSGKGVTSLVESPDGSLWYISDTQATWNIRRIRFLAGVNTAPVIHSLGASALMGPAPFQVTFTPHVVDTDTTQNSLVFAWEFGDGATANSRVPTHTYTVDGNFFVVLTVSDGTTITQSEFISIEVGSPPTITIQGMTSEEIASGISVIGGQRLRFDASAYDIADGDISAQLRWYEVFVHDDHTHAQGVEVTGTSYDVVVPTTGHSFEGSTGVRVSADSVNSRGLRTVRHCVYSALIV